MTKTTLAGAADRAAHLRRIARIVAGAGLLAVSACGPSPAPAPAPVAADAWHEFQGTWTATGSRRTIALGSDRQASIVDLRGSMLLAGPSRPGVGFQAEVIALGDNATGMVGRAVWTDENGDSVHSEIRGEGTSTGNRVAGTFIGGTGRYVGATGSYELTWQYVLQAEDGTVQGRAVGLSGRVRVADPQAAPSAQGVKP